MNFPKPCQHHPYCSHPNPAQQRSWERGRLLPLSPLQVGPSSPLAALPAPQHPPTGTGRKPQPQPAGS